MGCGCNKAKASVARGTSGVAAFAPSAPVYEVHNESGGLVASYSNPVTARAEARRIGGTVVDPSQTPAAPAE